LTKASSSASEAGPSMPTPEAGTSPPGARPSRVETERGLCPPPGSGEPAVRCARGAGGRQLAARPCCDQLPLSFLSLSSSPPPPPPSRTDWTRLVPPPVLTGHVSSLLPYLSIYLSIYRYLATIEAGTGRGRRARAGRPHARARGGWHTSAPRDGRGERLRDSGPEAGPESPEAGPELCAGEGTSSSSRSTCENRPSHTGRRKRRNQPSHTESMDRCEWPSHTKRRKRRGPGAGGRVPRGA